MGYVIYLNSNREGTRLLNSYGYWTGKTYTVKGEKFPICTGSIDDNTKVYKNKKNAVNGAEKAYLQYGYVSVYEVEELN